MTDRHPLHGRRRSEELDLLDELARAAGVFTDSEPDPTIVNLIEQKHRDARRRHVTQVTLAYLSAIVAAVAVVALAFWVVAVLAGATP